MPALATFFALALASEAIKATAAIPNRLVMDMETNSAVSGKSCGGTKKEASCSKQGASQD